MASGLADGSKEHQGLKVPQPQDPPRDGARRHRPVQDVGAGAGSWLSASDSRGPQDQPSTKQVGLGTPFLKPQTEFAPLKRSQSRGLGASVVVPTCLRGSLEVTARGLTGSGPPGSAEGQHPVPFRAAGAVAAGRAPQSLVPTTMAAEGHVGCFLEEGVKVSVEMSQVLEGGRCAHRLAEAEACYFKGFGFYS